MVVGIASMCKLHELEAYNCRLPGVLDTWTIQFPISSGSEELQGQQYQEYTKNTWMVDKELVVGQIAKDNYP
ncbi:hypothetical protein TNCV_3092631 [Trichonephila clavipes]|uniref:Uncharacterized protein n=1 Tax=Trichonephila clavipes TaxID=2585209 RepID=A0A8X6V3S8_TRICX|nr:hypothetical protein TNCV_3092631 [Trichonephila clavipes]